MTFIIAQYKLYVERRSFMKKIKVPIFSHYVMKHQLSFGTMILYFLLVIPMILFMVRRQIQFPLILLYLILGLFLLYVFDIFFFWIHQRKNKIPKYEYQYYREVSDELPPVVVNYFLETNAFSINGLLSELMYLIEREYILLTYDDKNFLLHYQDLQAKEQHHYQLTLNPKKDLTELHQIDAYLIEWLFQRSPTISLNHFSKEAFFSADFYQTFYKKVQNYCYEKKYIVNINYNKIIFCFCMMFIPFLFVAQHPIFSLFLFTICFSIFLNSAYHYSNLSEDIKIVLSKYKAFQNFIHDFSDMNHANIESLRIWNRYLVYATALSLTNELEKKLKQVLGDNLFYSENIKENLVA